jgi:segregation and condensation protein A
MLGSARDLDFDEAFGGEDKLTQAVTLFALLEMHKRGEATWEQGEVFGRIKIARREEARA